MHRAVLDRVQRIDDSANALLVRLDFPARDRVLNIQIILHRLLACTTHHRGVHGGPGHAAGCQARSTSTDVSQVVLGDFLHGSATVILNHVHRAEEALVGQVQNVSSLGPRLKLGALAMVLAHLGQCWRAKIFMFFLQPRRRLRRHEIQNVLITFYVPSFTFAERAFCRAGNRPVVFGSQRPDYLVIRVIGECATVAWHWILGCRQVETGGV